MPLLNVEEAAVHLHVSRSFLDKKRVTGGGPKYVKIGPKKVAYDRADLDKWLEDSKRTHTGEGGEANPRRRRRA